MILALALAGCSPARDARAPAPVMSPEDVAQCDARIQAVHKPSVAAAPGIDRAKLSTVAECATEIEPTTRIATCGEAAELADVFVGRMLQAYVSVARLAESVTCRGESQRSVCLHDKLARMDESIRLAAECRQRFANDLQAGKFLQARDHFIRLAAVRSSVETAASAAIECVADPSEVRAIHSGGRR